MANPLQPGADRPGGGAGRVSAVIVNWNGLRYLDACLDPLQAEPELGEVIVVDNGSTDGSLEHLAVRTGVRVLAQGRNLGYAEANNAGIAAAGCDLVLLLNNDTRPRPGFLAPLVEALDREPLAGAAQAKLLTVEQPPRIDSYGSYLTWSGFLYHRLFEQPDPPPEPPFEVFAAKGAALLLRRDLLAQVGAFDADFFAYMEDTDLCWRIWLSGRNVLCVPASVVLHVGGGTAGTLASEVVIFHSFKNRLTMLVKNLSGARLAAVLPIHLALCLGAAAAYAARGRWRQARGILGALGWEAAHLGSVLARRRLVQRTLRRVSDAELWPAVARRPRLAYYYLLLSGGLRGYRE